MARHHGLKKQHSEVNSIYRVVSDSVIAAATAVGNMEKSSRLSLKSSATEVAKCECCGLGEECTAGYVKRVQRQFLGHFVCGLCAEAVKEEQARLSSGNKMPNESSEISEEAIRVHMNICKQFNCAMRENPVAAATTAMRQLLVRRAGAGSPRLQKPAFGSGSGLARSSSCIPALAAQSLNWK